MSVLTGVVGKATIAGTVTPVTNWTLNIANNKSEISPLGGKDLSFTQTTRGATGSFTVALLDKASEVASVKALINQQLSSGTLASVAIILYHDATDTWTGTVAVDGFSISNNVSDVLFCTFTFTKTGTWTDTPATT